jgi:hypothetical protein
MAVKVSNASVTRIRAALATTFAGCAESELLPAVISAAPVNPTPLRSSRRESDGDTPLPTSSARVLLLLMIDAPSIWRWRRLFLLKCHIASQIFQPSSISIWAVISALLAFLEIVTIAIELIRTHGIKPAGCICTDSGLCHADI